MTVPQPSAALQVLKERADNIGVLNNLRNYFVFAKQFIHWKMVSSTKETIDTDTAIADVQWYMITTEIATVTGNDEITIMIIIVK